MPANGLLILYGLAFIPTSGLYGPALDSARKAAFIQSGIKADWDTVAEAAERRVPPILRKLAPVAASAYRHELELNSKAYKFNIRPDGARVLLTLEW